MNYLLYTSYQRISCPSNVSDVRADVFKRRKVKNNKYTYIYTQTFCARQAIYSPDGKIVLVFTVRGVGEVGALIILINYETTSGDRSGGNNVISRQLKREMRASSACSCRALPFVLPTVHRLHAHNKITLFVYREG